ncbi:MAG TPA: phosphoribosylglycinamide formyltransferase [Vicinamibacteria bacterium]|nr:phosphoribosylglycinamide formyltransferase [Vicinamibacteria bacterium]
MRNLGVLISGRGSNLQAILAAVSEGRLEARVGVVISNVASARGLERARAAGVPTAIVSHRDFPSREDFDTAIVAELREHHVDLVCLAGFMRILSPVLVNAFPERILNIHPSLLPSFPGLDAQRRALEHGVKVSGASVHFVDEQLDHGPIVLQRAVPVFEDDDEQALAARILEEEHKLYPEAIALVLDGRVRIEGRRAVIRECRSTNESLI